MAGTFTHLMICKEGLTRQAVLGSDLRQFLNKYSQFVYLGAVSPDLAYLSFKTGHTNWADAMHYEKTNSIVISGFEELRTAGLMRAPVEEVKLAWLLGYASHLVTDATIHPIVNAIVGDYDNHQTEHRVCEMTQDSLVFHEIYSSDIAYAEFSQILEYCRDSDAFEPLMEFWKSQLLLNYPEKGEEPHPSVWFKTYADEAIDAAEGGSKLVGLFRHLGLAKTYLYHTKAEIEANYPADKHDFYDAVKTPKGVGPFWDLGFEEAVDNVIAAWKSLYAGLSYGLVVAEVVKNWDLDTGEDMDNPGVFTFWEGSKQAPTTEGDVKPTPQAQVVRVVPGPSTHIATDIWTLKDSLGYRAYAQAIADFIQHPLTRPPLTISIQAPWGGGKTSMMRMIQEYLDPEGIQGFVAEVTGSLKTLEKSKDELGETGKGAKTPGNIGGGENGKTEKAGPTDTSSKKILTVGQVLAEVQGWWQKSQEETLPLPILPQVKKKKILTVWFNAWKYESINQVWAGLAHAIMEQVTKRLSPLERERFYLRLNLKRFDYDKIRKKVYGRVWAGCWEKVTGWIGWLAGALGLIFLATIGGWFVDIISLRTFGGLFCTSAILSIAGGSLFAIKNYKEAEQKENGKPAAASLGDFLKIPSYGAELGFVHQAEVDLKRFLEILKDKGICLVVFVDDLDRCSPVKVAQVMEAVNLFLAGDFPESIFIMGMDTEMVAAALQAHHRELIACLPEDAGIPLGWRFMDKFVQLPFLISPAENEEVVTYLTALMSENRSETENLEIQKVANEIAKTVNSLEDLDRRKKDIEHRGDIKADTLREAANLVKNDIVSREISKSISEFNDNPEILAVISECKQYFRGNPRELKRFVNAYRFQHCLWSAREKQKLPVPSLTQLLRWTVFSIKWPEVVRWCRQKGCTEWEVKEDTQGAEKKPMVRSRLKILEKIGSQANNLKSWQEQAQEVLHLNSVNTPWLHDDGLLQFFHNEVSDFPEGDRLSDGEGKGLW